MCSFEHETAKQKARHTKGFLSVKFPSKETPGLVVVDFREALGNSFERKTIKKIITYDRTNRSVFKIFDHILRKKVWMNVKKKKLKSLFLCYFFFQYLE